MSELEKEDIEPDMLEPSVDIKLCCMRVRIWWYIILSLQALILLLMLGGLGSESWAKQGTGSGKWEGGLNYISSSEIYEKVDYIDMAATYCDIDDLFVDKDLADALCNTFTNMRGAGAAFNFFEVFAYVFTLIWMIRVIYCFLEKKMFSNCWGYVWPSLGIFFHILAEIIWGGATGATFTESCDDLNDGADSAPVCATDGPSVCLLVTLLYIITAIIFFVVYNRRRGPVEEQEDNESAHSRTQSIGGANTQKI